jgi:hypothetical protein
MLSQKYGAVNFSPAGRASMTGKPNGDQKMMISTFGVEMICLALVGAISPHGSHIVHSLSNRKTMTRRR